MHCVRTFQKVRFLAGDFVRLERQFLGHPVVPPGPVNRAGTGNPLNEFRVDRRGESRFNLQGEIAEPAGERWPSDRVFQRGSVKQSLLNNAFRRGDCVLFAAGQHESLSRHLFQRRVWFRAEAESPAVSFGLQLFEQANDLSSLP